MADNSGNVHKDAFWLYGIIVGLAIREALTSVLPHIFVNSAIPFHHFLEGIRLFTFLILIIRFYLGSVVFFRDAYTCDGAQTEYSRKNYLLDFLAGFLHFLIFFALATSINIHDRPLRLFPVLLAVVLLYDIPWLAINWSNDTFDLIKMWTFVNILTLLVSSLVYVVAILAGGSFARAEELALLPVIIVSLVDIGGIVADRQLFVSALQKVISRRGGGG